MVVPSSEFLCLLDSLHYRSFRVCSHISPSLYVYVLTLVLSQLTLSHALHHLYALFNALGYVLSLASLLPQILTSSTHILNAQSTKLAKISHLLFQQICVHPSIACSFTFIISHLSKPNPSQLSCVQPISRQLQPQHIQQEVMSHLDDRRLIPLKIAFSDNLQELPIPYYSLTNLLQNVFHILFHPINHLLWSIFFVLHDLSFQLKYVVLLCQWTPPPPLGVSSILHVVPKHA